MQEIQRYSENEKVSSANKTKIEKENFRRNLFIETIKIKMKVDMDTSMTFSMKTRLDSKT